MLINREPQMFKTVLTLFRGGIAVAGEELEDRTALVILDQQMREAAAAVHRSKRTLALASAEHHQADRSPPPSASRISTRVHGPRWVAAARIAPARRHSRLRVSRPIAPRRCPRARCPPRRSPG